MRLLTKFKTCLKFKIHRPERISDCQAEFTWVFKCLFILIIMRLLTKFKTCLKFKIHRPERISDCQAEFLFPETETEEVQGGEKVS